MYNDVFVRNPYNYDVDVASDEAGLKCEDLSLAVQSERDECDINTIVKRFGLTGTVPVGGVMPPSSGDFTGVSSYHEAANLILAADAEFMRVPAEIRTRFNNDAGEFVAFLDDVNNREEAIKLRLIVPSVAEVSEAPPSSGT